MTKDDDLYIQALDEVTTKKGLDKAIWARALVETMGDETAATATYISNRVKTLLKSQQSVRLSQSHNGEETNEITASFISPSAAIKCPNCNVSEKVHQINDRPDSRIYLSNFGRVRVADGLEIKKAVCFSCDVSFELVLEADSSIEYFVCKEVGQISGKEIEEMLVEATRYRSPAKEKLERIKSGHSEIDENALSNGFLLQLKSGQFGLAKTWWVFNAIPNVIVGVISEASFSITVLFFLGVVQLFYQWFSLNGLWRAATAYKGNTLWKVLAQMMTFLGWFFWGGTILIMFRLLINNQ